MTWSRSSTWWSGTIRFRSPRVASPGLLRAVEVGHDPARVVLARLLPRLEERGWLGDDELVEEFKRVMTGDADGLRPTPVDLGELALAAGPDVWEIVARLRDLRGSEEDRIAMLADESDLHPRQIRIALEFAARHADDVEARIARNEQAISDGRHAAEQRQALLA